MLKVSFDWDAAQQLKGMSDENFARLREIWPADLSDNAREYGFGITSQRLTLTEVAAIQELGIQPTIKGVDGTMLSRLKDHPSGPAGTVEEGIANGSVVQIAVPDIGLLAIRHVKVMGDACTDELQEMLDDGWRILAVCPPNARRRPDYILGRDRL